MSKYIDRVVTKLKRKYGKDELVAHLIAENSRLSTDIGKQDAEILYLENEVKSLKSLDNDERSVLYMDEEIQKEKKKAKHWREKHKELNKKYNNLHNDYIKLKLKESIGDNPQKLVNDH